MIYFLIGADYRSIITDVPTGVKAWILLKDDEIILAYLKM
jgi:hypothetical protein